MNIARFSAVAAAAKPRAPAADRQQHFQLGVLFAQHRQPLQIGRYLRRQVDLVAASGVFQRRIGFVFLAVVDQTERIVEVGDLRDVQLVDVATGAGGDVAAAVEVADGEISRLSRACAGHSQLHRRQ